ncbi:protein-glutamate O-methyltransferase CheR [Desulfobacterales bacterium HSG2]|nr:protein-glutamate O-methyltransferase CheR [Desulfobacterales bacterium HSG2]
MLRINEQEFKLLRDFIENECGVMLGKEKAYLIENRLSKLAKDCGCNTFGEFYRKLSNSRRTDELRSLTVDAITTHETLWFRDQQPFKILEERLLPEYQKAIQQGKRADIKIWSAACATGQEPYSIAMTAMEFYLRTGCEEESCCRQMNILATDVSSAILAAAEAGRYDANAMTRGLPSESLNRYFKKEKNEWILNPEIRNMVTFRQLNLKDPIAGIIGPFDIIFLRNVIIYFSETFKKLLLNRVAGLLNPGGYLFLGAGETVGGYSEAFEILEYDGTIFYQIKT